MKHIDCNQRGHFATRRFLQLRAPLLNDALTVRGAGQTADWSCRGIVGQQRLRIVDCGFANILEVGELSRIIHQLVGRNEQTLTVPELRSRSAVHKEVQVRCRSKLRLHCSGNQLRDGGPAYVSNSV